MDVPDEPMVWTFAGGLDEGAVIGEDDFDEAAKCQII